MMVRDGGFVQERWPKAVQHGGKQNHVPVVQSQEQ